MRYLSVKRSVEQVVYFEIHIFFLTSRSFIYNENAIIQIVPSAIHFTIYISRRGPLTWLRCINPLGFVYNAHCRWTTWRSSEVYVWIARRKPQVFANSSYTRIRLWLDRPIDLFTPAIRHESFSEIFRSLGVRTGRRSFKKRTSALRQRTDVITANNSIWTGKTDVQF